MLLACVAASTTAGCGPASPVEPDAALVVDATADAPEVADLILDHDALDLGWICPGRVGEATVRIVNAGRVASSEIEASIIGAQAGLFAVRHNGCDEGIEPRSFCEVIVAFEPVEFLAEIDATLALSGTEGAWSLPLTAEVPSCESRFTITPFSHAFPDTARGATSDVTFFTIQNWASFRSLPLTVGVSGLDGSEFRISPTGDTCSGQSIPALGTCTVGVLYAPSARGVHTGSLQVSQADDFVQAALQGRARSVTGLVFFGSWTDFGTSCEPVTSDIALTNDGDVAVGPIEWTFEGGDTTAFSVVSDTCGASVASGASCAVRVQLVDGLPAGSYASTLRASWGGSTIEHPVTGTRSSCASLAILEPALYDFGSLTVGDVSAPFRFTLRNASGAALGPFTIVLRDGMAGEFGVAADACTGVSLLPAATCTFDVRFAPTLLGAASTFVEATAPLGRVTAAVQGRGT